MLHWDYSTHKLELIVAHLEKDCNNIGEISGAMELGQVEGEIPEPMKLYHEKTNRNRDIKACHGGRIKESYYICCFSISC